MFPSRRRLALAACGAVLTALIPAAGAGATVGSSSITTPADPTYRTYNADLGAGAAANRLTVSGRAASSTPASDRVDVRCFWNDSTGALHANPFALRVPLAADGSFTASADPATLSDNPFAGGTKDDAAGVQTCRLRATPAVTAIGDLDSATLPDFQGPRIDVARFGSASLPVRGGGNVTVDFSVGAGGLRGQAEWASAAGCGPFSFRPFVNPGALSPSQYPNWDCVLAILAPAAGDGTSQLIVDGRNAFTGSSAPSLDFDADGSLERPAGAGGLAVDYRRNPTTGDVTSTERSPVQRCDGAAFPPTVASCGTLVGTGLDFERTVTLADDGLEATVTDVLRSTDGAAHAVDERLEQFVVFDNAPVFRFPGDDTFAPYGPGAQPALGPGGPATVLTRDAVTPDTARQGTGAETWDARPDDVRFFSTNYSYLERSARMVPAGGALTQTHVFRTARTLGEAAAGARTAEDRLSGPSLTLTGPADGSTVGVPQAVVTGAATDTVGVVSLTVGGQPAPVGIDGLFSVPVSLLPGANTIPVVARDGAGNVAQAALTITFVPPKAPAVTTSRRCIVPRLSRSSLYGTARSKIKKAGCKVGRVRHVRSYLRRGRLVRIVPGGGKRVALGTRVAISLSDGKGKRPARRKAKKRAAVQRVAVAATRAAAADHARERKLPGR
jgi:Glucodextranase, domain B